MAQVPMAFVCICYVYDRLKKILDAFFGVPTKANQAKTKHCVPPMPCNPAHYGHNVNTGHCPSCNNTISTVCLDTIGLRRLTKNRGGQQGLHKPWVSQHISMVKPGRRLDLGIYPSESTWLCAVHVCGVRGPYMVVGGACVPLV